MILSAKKGNFKPAPEGVHDAVCIDVVDLGILPTKFGPKPKLRLCFQIDKLDSETNKRFYVARRFTASIHPKADFAKFIQQWRGKAFTKEELEAFDTEKLVGACAQLVIVHQEREGEVYADITSILKPKKKLPLDKDYVRVKDRPDTQATMHEPPADEQYSPPVDADDVPF